MATYKVVVSTYASTYASIDANGKGKTKNNTILMGSFVRMLGQSEGDWTKVSAFDIDGWIKKADLGVSAGLKVFYVDVGQGDGALIEIGNPDDTHGLRILIDGGPSNNMSRYLSKWQFKYYYDRGEKIHIDYIFISHFDKDHYEGLISILNDDHYTFGTIYHNGIAKFKMPATGNAHGYNSTLGKKIKIPGKTYLVTFFDDFDSLMQLKADGELQLLMENFAAAVKNAKDNGRLEAMQRLDSTKAINEANINEQIFKIEVLGPVTENIEGQLAFRFFTDDAHTVNGHSLVLKFTYGDRTVLFGGDLNIPSEKHLLLNAAGNNPFEADVAKSCHHGASEFTLEYMAAVNPYATVISSGDNETYSHPRADAIGCAGKYSKSTRPLVFSTELARSSNVETDSIKFGMINLRSDGKSIIMAQMKEASGSGDVWDLYEVL
ncbi:MAG TPA: hypothetical protein VK625_02580 [Flavitalea sp.]|nr:hypothetical protein [Flavitalea sp.]